MMPSNSLCALNPFSLEGEMGVAIQSGGLECTEVSPGVSMPSPSDHGPPQLPHQAKVPPRRPGGACKGLGPPRVVALLLL